MSLRNYIINGYVSCFLLCSCEKVETTTLENHKPYEGPVMQMANVKMYYSDSAHLKVQMNAPVQNEFLNGDRYFPKGLLIYFYQNGAISSSLTANSGKFIKATGIYTVNGNVIIKSVEESKQMNTEQLHWNPSTKKINTDKFVRIQTSTEILTGVGLDANEDFQHYRIRHPTGVFTVNQK